MEREESLYPADWLRIAKKDWKRVEGLLEEDPELAGFCLQQAVEKFLKAYLISQGWKLQRTHDLQALLNAALDYDPSLELYRGVCQRITGFYLLERYPLIAEVSLTEQEVHDAWQGVKGLIDKLRGAIAGK